MQFHEFPEKLLGSKVKIKLLRRFLTDETITSERELAKLVEISPGSANKILKEFSECNLISPLRVGNTIAWQLNRKSYAYDFITHFAEKIKSTPLSELQGDIKRYVEAGYFSTGTSSVSAGFGIRDIKIKKIIMFGSLVAGTELPQSDIDLFILVEGNDDRRKIGEYFGLITTVFLQRYGNRLSLNVFTSKEFTDPKNKKFLENVSRGIVVMEK